MESDLIRKIRGLLATAESLAATGHEEAAGAYIAKAHALQQKHSIDAALLDAASGTAGSPERGAVVTQTWLIPAPYGRRKVDLAHVVARRTGCTGYFEPASARGDGHYRFVVFGFPADVEWAETLFVSLVHQADSALDAAGHRRDLREHGRSFATSFMAGFTATVNQRLKEASEQAEAEAAATAGTAPTSVSLVLAGKTARVEAEMRASVSHPRTSRSNGGTSRSGFDQGRSAGRRASLARGSVGGRNGARNGDQAELAG
jgi:hypothetical protein